MKRVLIVDDDFLVRTYLKQMIDWQAQGLYVVGDAKNGQEALELLQREGADILIADVSMPIMDGIELTRHVKKLSPRTHILILSCHDDFVYVKEAMRLGIDDYLLKNDLSEATLLDALNKISFEEEPDSAIEKFALIGRKKLREDFFAAFDAAEFDRLEDLALEAELDLKSGATLMIIPGNWRQREQLLGKTDLENFLAAFAEMTLNVCRNLLGDTVSAQIFHSERGGFFHWGLLVNRADRELAERLQNFSELYFNLRLKIILSAEGRTLGEAAELWQKLYDARADSFYSDETIILAAETAPLTAALGGLKLCGEKLIEALGFGDEDFSSALNSFRTEILNVKPRPEILFEFMRRLFDSERDLLPEADSFGEWFELLEKFLANLRGRQGKDYLHPAIRLALKYIEAHCHEELSQTEVAEAVHLNTSYFSTLFKKSVGKGFTDYLTELRIEHVKARLVTSSEKIKDIAESEGFNDYQYFCQLFKRLTGLAPRDYRRKFLK